MYKVRQSAKRFLSTIQYTRTGEQPDVAPNPIRTTTKTSSGITVTTVDDLGPVSHVAVYMNAGSRNESKTAPGTIPGDNIVRTFRDTELRGNSLYASSGREHILLGSEFLRDDVVDVVPTLISNAFNKSFQVYEFVYALEKTDGQTQASLADPEVKVTEELHRVAFRNGLGNSALASTEALKNLKRADLEEFGKKYFSKDRVAVVATGVNHQDLVELVESSLGGIDFTAAAPATEKSTYYGGESRFEAGPKSTALYEIGFVGASTATQDYYTSLVLAEIFNAHSGVKYGCNSKIGTEKTTTTGFSASYSDAGLVGFTVKGDNAEVKQVAQNAINELKAATNISPAQFEAAKKAAIITFETSNTRGTLIENLGKESTSSFSYHVSGLEKVTAEDVKKFAKQALSKKPSIVAYGNLNVLPYADELSF